MDPTDVQIARMGRCLLTENLPHPTVRVIIKTANAMHSIRKDAGDKGLEKYFRNLTDVQKKAINELIAVYEEKVATLSARDVGLLQGFDLYQKVVLQGR